MIYILSQTPNSQRTRLERTPLLEGFPITKNRNTYLKRQREQDKKQRADDKRAKRVKKAEEQSVDPVLIPKVERL